MFWLTAIELLLSGDYKGEGKENSVPKAAALLSFTDSVP